MSFLRYLITLVVSLSFVTANPNYWWHPWEGNGGSGGFGGGSGGSGGGAQTTAATTAAAAAQSSAVVLNGGGGGGGGGGFGGSQSTSAAQGGGFFSASTTSSASGSQNTDTNGGSSSVDAASASSSTTSFSGGFNGGSGSGSSSTTTTSSSDSTPTEGAGGFFGASTTTSASSSQSTGSTGSTSNGGGASGALALDPNLLQTASDSDGDASVEAGQSPSITDPANFINFCGTTGQQLTNGTQITDGSCNGVIMGQIPSKNNMISTIITFPQSGSTIPSNQPFNVTLQVSNLVAGSFTNPNTTYYSAPQTLQGGKIVGHTHITVQSLDNLNTNNAPDPTLFAFFKGVNDAGNGDGGLSAPVAKGLPAGFYRVCTMSSASNHQPVLMPVSSCPTLLPYHPFTDITSPGRTTRRPRRLHPLHRLRPSQQPHRCRRRLLAERRRW